MRGDSAGSFWRFDATDLEPDTEYELALHDGRGGGGRGRALLDPWPLRTFPLPDAEMDRVRLLVYTCAGGYEGLPEGAPTPAFLSLATRQRLLRRALSFAPRAVIANGDHVYWDQTTAGRGKGIRSVAGAIERTGEFATDQPVFGGENERVLQRAVGPQIADLYGTMLRSLPVFFLQDDHDYFEGDAAADFAVSFPPEPFMLELGRATQRLYYPEFLPDAGRPLGLAGTGAPDRAAGVSEAFGTLRCGKLLELAAVGLPPLPHAQGRGGDLRPDRGRALDRAACRRERRALRRQRAVGADRLERRQVGRVVPRRARRRAAA